MLIDWFTVIAQIVNFLVLVWLLKRFLYGRIISALNARENAIAARIAGAEAKEKQAGEQLAHHQATLQDLEQQREAMLTQARLDADRQRTEMIEKAREQLIVLEAKWEQDLDRERDTFLLDLRRRAATEILAIARRVVADLSGADVQQCAVRVFLEKIRTLDRDAWINLARAELFVRSAIDLSEDTRAEIRRTIEEQTESPVDIRFESAPGMGLGLELRGNGRRIGWNSESYLEAMEEDLREALESRTESATHAGVA